MPCKLARIAGTFSDFEGAAGQQVTMVTMDHIGVVLIQSATYNDEQLVPVGTAVSRLTLSVVPGMKTLKIVAVFAASTAGRGELREIEGEDSQFLINLPGNDPFQTLRISGKV
jgi:hypothetical protein